MSIEVKAPLFFHSFCSAHVWLYVRMSRCAFSGTSSFKCINSLLVSKTLILTILLFYKIRAVGGEFVILWPWNCHYMPPPCRLHMASLRLPLYVKHMLLLQCLSNYQGSNDLTRPPSLQIIYITVISQPDPHFSCIKSPSFSVSSTECLLQRLIWRCFANSLTL